MADYCEYLGVLASEDEMPVDHILVHVAKQSLQ